MKGGVWLCGLRVIQRCLTWKIWYLTLLISMHVFSPQGLFARSVLNLESWKKREIAGMLLTLWIAQREHTASLELLYKNGFVLKYITLSSESIFFQRTLYQQHIEWCVISLLPLYDRIYWLLSMQHDMWGVKMDILSRSQGGGRKKKDFMDQQEEMYSTNITSQQHIGTACYMFAQCCMS